MASVCNGMCGLSKVVVVGALVAGGAIGIASLTRADDKPSQAIQNQGTQAQESNAKPAEGAQVDAAKSEKEKAVQDAFVLDHTMKDIAGTDQALSQYAGKVLLMVNVASKCGFTPQYKGLEELFDAKKEKGLVVMGFPANNFGKQEPGSDAEIQEFCSTKYGVSFPMFSKVSVKGDDICGLYKDLTSQPAPIGGEVGWNFTKFLVDRSGKVVARFDSRTRPDDVEMNKKIDELLAAAAPAATKAADGEKQQGEKKDGAAAGG
jgi:glutathione peroxidase